MPFLATQSQIRSGNGLHGLGSAHTHATRAAAARNAVVRKVVRLRGLNLGDVNCTIDPQTGGRVCGNSPVLTVPVPVATPVSNLPPGGSYTQTCNSVSYNGGVLTANCQRIDGGFQPSTLNVGSNCPGGTVVNINGQLQCATQVPIATQTNPNPVATLSPVGTSPANVVNPATGQSIPVIIDPNTGIAFTSEYPLSQINPITGYPFNFAGQSAPAPSNFVNTAPAVPAQTSSIPSWLTLNNVLVVGGIGVGGLILLKLLGVIKK